MRRLYSHLVAVGALCTLVAASGTAGQNDPVVPVHQEPRHRMVFDSPGTRILDVQIPAGDTTLFHTHSDPILYVTMSTSQTRSQPHGGEWSAAAATAGAPTGPPRVVPSNPPARLMSTTSYAVKPQTHRVNNVGSSLFRLIGITNASVGDTSTAPSADFEGPPELSNQWFRGYRLNLTSAESGQHRHVNPTVLVLVTGRLTADLGTTAKTLDQPGQFVFVEPNVVHRLHAVDAAAQLVEIEVRRPH